tara:strand:+ start:951 stop:1634 length:684 start_codon:yes stop_codon:yes gene_type:complete
MKTFRELQEGLNDPNIFKAFFLAGGPGSGKSYVAKKTIGGSGLRTVNSDDAFEALLTKAGLSMKMPPEEEAERDIVRGRAKAVTKKRQDNYLEGRIGLIIDGTGKDYDKIARQSSALRELGYDTHMIFVNTSLDVALERNQKRDRTVPEPLVIKSWKEVQANIGKFQNLFRSNFIVVDNNDAQEDVLTSVFKEVRKMLNKKVTNIFANQWVEREMKRRGVTKKPKGF